MLWLFIFESTKELFYSSVWFLKLKKIKYFVGEIKRKGDDRQGAVGRLAGDRRRFEF